MSKILFVDERVLEDPYKVVKSPPGVVLRFTSVDQPPQQIPYVEPENTIEKDHLRDAVNAILQARTQK